MNTCKNCDALLNGKFCSSCGQKVYTEKDKSVKHLLHEAFHFITHFEGKFFTTTKAIFLKPGKLSSDYSMGIRQKYYKPISLYLLIVVIYLLFPLFEGLNMEMKYYKEMDVTGPIFTSQIENKMKEQNMTEEVLAEKFHQKSAATSKVLLLLLIPFTVPILYMLYFYKKRSLFDNLILATEINIFYLLVFYILFPILVYLIIQITGFFPGERMISIVLSIGFIFYIGLLFRRLFAERWWLTFLKSVFFVVLHTAMLQLIYKTIVFEVTLLFI